MVKNDRVFVYEHDTFVFPLLKKSCVHVATIGRNCPARPATAYGTYLAFGIPRKDTLLPAKLPALLVKRKFLGSTPTIGSSSACSNSSFSEFGVSECLVIRCGRVLSPEEKLKAMRSAWFASEVSSAPGL